MTTAPRSQSSICLRFWFFALTILCCVLGWQSNIVHQRQALRARAPQGVSFRTDGWSFAGRPPATISVVRTWLGDEAVQEVDVSHAAFADPGLEQKYLRTFNEAAFTFRPKPPERMNMRKGGI